ncbi:uncharacterized protein RHO17_004429 [Thomomys bottae]
MALLVSSLQIVFLEIKGSLCKYLLSAGRAPVLGQNRLPDSSVSSLNCAGFQKYLLGFFPDHLWTSRPLSSFILHYYFTLQNYSESQAVSHEFSPCKGGKNRRRGKNENESQKRELVFKEAGQEYAQVLKMLGNGRLEEMCFDGIRRLCHIRGKLRKKVWINASDIILVGLRDYQDNKADVILKYNADEARNLKAYGELPEHDETKGMHNYIQFVS